MSIAPTEAIEPLWVASLSDTSYHINTWNNPHSYGQLAITVLRFVEIVVIIGCYVCYAFSIHILTTKTVYHRNLRAALLLISLNDVVMVSVRLTYHIDVLAKGGDLTQISSNYELIADMTLVVSYTALFTLAVERCMATACYRSYERMCGTVPIPAIICFVFQLMLAVALAYIVKNQLIGTIILYAPLIGTMILSACFLLVLPRWSRRVAISSLKTFKLSTRYQAMENARCARMLTVYTMHITIFSLLSGAVVGVILFLFSPPYRLLGMAVTFIFEEIKALITILIPMVFNGYSQKLWRRIRRNHETAPENTASTITNSHGKVLAFSADREAEIYFTTYASAWNSLPTRQRTGSITSQV